MYIYNIIYESFIKIKKFTNNLEKEYRHVISEVLVLEDIFSVKKGGIVNPNLEKQKTFV